VIYYLVCAAIAVEYLLVLGWSAVILGGAALAIAILAFRTRHRAWWRLPLSAAALAGCLASIYRFGVIAAALTCTVVFGVVAGAWAAGHNPQGHIPEAGDGQRPSEVSRRG
jgi:hypothetical protein